MTIMVHAADTSTAACPAWCTHHGRDGAHMADTTELPASPGDKYGPFPAITVDMAQLPDQAAPLVTLTVADLLTLDEIERLSQILAAVVERGRAAGTAVAR